MSRSFPIERPDPRSDRPRVWPIAAIAVAGLVAGVLLVRATFDEPRSEAGPPSTAREAEAGSLVAASPVSQPADAGASVEEAAADAGTLAVPPPVPVFAVADAGVRSTPRPALPGRGPASGRAVTLGRIAYLRCDGAETSAGPIPCPRDHALEDAAIAILESLPGCPNAPAEPGEADIRIHFERGSAPEVRLRATGARRLDGPRLLACVSDPLSQLTTTIRAEKLIVSFRFELR